MTATTPMKGFPSAALSTKDSARSIINSTQGSTLADVLERVLDKGIVIAGDISISVATTELINIRIRLLISSVDKAREIGINWWENNPHFSAQSQNLIDTNHQLQQRVENLEAELRTLHRLAATKEA
ncbi:MAG: gas vesicle protein [Kovacikia sp.]